MKGHITSRYYYATAVAAAVVLTALSYLLQMYQFTSLEEAHIMVYDMSYVNDTIEHPGGVAQIIASLCSQFFIHRWAGPAIAGLLYLLTMLPLTALSARLRTPLWVTALTALPCLCLMLCLENSSYELQGTVSVMLTALAIRGYCWLKDAPAPRTFAGTALAVMLYLIAGTAALAYALGVLAYDIAMRRRHAWLSIAYPLVSLATGYICYLYGLVHTTQDIYTPAIYYEMGSTYYMMVYVLCVLALFPLLAALTKHHDNGRPAIQVAVALAVLILQAAVMLTLYSKIHSAPNYRNQQERYMARHGQWAEIAALPYNGEATPYTSYRFLALAELGQLTDKIDEYRPFISYLLENKPKVKKRDQQIYSDIYYACCYMAAARHSAFDTDIVTPGAFNPYETQKLAMINIAYGDYGVADKLLTKLERTLYYKDWAKEHRKFLYDDKAVAANPELGRMRRAIPPVNEYLSPKGIERDLRQIADNDSTQIAARQFYEAFVKLTQTGSIR